MNDIYKKKAEKYKYKYLKLKKEIEYIGKGGYLPNYFSEDGYLPNYFSEDGYLPNYFSEGGYLPNYFSEERFNTKVDKLIEKYINIDSTNLQISIKEDDKIKDSFNPMTENKFNYQVYNRIKEYAKKYPQATIETIETPNDKPSFFTLISEIGFNNQIDKRIKKYIQETLEKANKEALEKEHTNFINNIQNVKNAIEQIIIPLYDNNKIIGNINKDEIIKSDYNVDPNKNPKQCYHDKLNEVSNQYTFITKSKVIDIFKNCNFNTLNNFLDDLLFSKQKQTDLNDKKNNIKYDNNYIFNLNFLKENIEIHNYDLYLLYDIIYDLYDSLNQTLKIKYNDLFYIKQYAETPDDLIKILDKILNIN